VSIPLSADTAATGAAELAERSAEAEELLELVEDEFDVDECDDEVIKQMNEYLQGKEEKKVE
jgi:hypothetical protein